MNRNIHLSESLSLPLDIAGEAVGILATRGAGKSFTSAVLVEELYQAGIQFAVLDPTGVYHGLRTAANGKDPGIPVIIIGGPHGDVPLEDTAGHLIADLLVDTNQSLILDLSDFPTKKSQAKFVTDFAEKLYRRKARSRSTIHLVIDEADEFAPQKPLAYETMMLHHIEVLVRRGRSRGIGMTLITQRSATLNKNVLDLIDTLIAMRVGSPRDRAAVTSWITVKGEEDKIDVDGSLPGMPTGAAWVWSPVRGILEYVPIRHIRTFDSYATPKPGHARKEPKSKADIDINLLGEQIKATAARAKESDPAELKKRIRELEVELKKKSAVVPPEIKTVEVQVISAELASQIKASGQELMDLYKKVYSALDGKPVQHTQAVWGGPGRITQANEPQRKLNAAIRKTMDTAATDKGDLTGPEQRILNSIAWFESLGIQAPENTAVAFMAGYKPGGGAYNNPKGKLRGYGLITYAGDTLSLTLSGRQAAAYPESVSSNKELHQRILSRLGGPEQRILKPLIYAYPGSIEKDELAQMSGYSPDGGAFNNPRGRLRSLGLIEYIGTASRARDILFPIK